MTIEILPQQLINQIAAGEVVERPASAAKELIENAIDAGASFIQVFIEQGGLTRLSVSDNGNGMSVEDLPRAILRHATSKLPHHNLDRIEALGFRGEALPAIASVSRMTITTRNASNDAAYELRIDGGVEHSITPAARSLGTTVEVRDLFYATPARLKFMKTAAAETMQITDIVKRLALSYPQISFELRDPNRVLFRTESVSDDLLKTRESRVADVLGQEFIQNAVAIEAQRGEMSLSGFISLPTYHRGNAQAQYAVVNGRPLRDKQILGALRAAYQDVLPSDRYPSVALYLNVNPSEIDVNVHPAKIEVRFREAAMVRSFIINAIRETLRQHSQQSATHIANDTIAQLRASNDSYSFHSTASYARFNERADHQFDFKSAFFPAAKTELETADPPNQFPLGAARAQLPA